MKRGTEFGKLLIFALPFICLAQNQDDYDKRIINTVSFNTYGKISGLNQPQDTSQIFGAHTVSIFDKVAFSAGSPPQNPRSDLSSAPATGALGQQTSQLTSQQTLQPAQPQTLQPTQQPAQQPTGQKIVRELAINGNGSTGSLQESSPSDKTEQSSGPVLQNLGDQPEHKTESKKLAKQNHAGQTNRSGELKKILKVVVKPASERASERRLLDLLKNINPHQNKLAAPQPTGFDQFFPVI